ncbi:hypothetical protein DPMN_004846 [Dreissena polymorpha]|uniref:Uncharacterized protein n=1 Tax=Dreissena polymorpha TaxID=45954 RepID=A0A9D4MS30_DREPO|nr:hypothetical protein DPMN_004846 [Dreissena polymorpha]
MLMKLPGNQRLWDQHLGISGSRITYKLSSEIPMTLRYLESRRMALLFTVPCLISGKRGLL